MELQRANTELINRVLKLEQEVKQLKAGKCGGGECRTLACFKKDRNIRQ